MRKHKNTIACLNANILVHAVLRRSAFPKVEAAKDAESLFITDVGINC
jgi:hypothetical protein